MLFTRYEQGCIELNNFALFKRDRECKCFILVDGSLQDCDCGLNDGLEFGFPGEV